MAGNVKKVASLSATAGTASLISMMTLATITAWPTAKMAKVMTVGCNATTTASVKVVAGIVWTGTILSTPAMTAIYTAVVYATITACST